MFIHSKMFYAIVGICSIPSGVLVAFLLHGAALDTPTAGSTLSPAFLPTANDPGGCLTDAYLVF